MAVTQTRGGGSAWSWQDWQRVATCGEERWGPTRNVRGLFVADMCWHCQRWILLCPSLSATRSKEAKALTKIGRGAS